MQIHARESPDCVTFYTCATGFQGFQLASARPRRTPLLLPESLLTPGDRPPSAPPLVVEVVVLNSECLGCASPFPKFFIVLSYNSSRSTHALSL